jgi:hypothetical protein
MNVAQIVAQKVEQWTAGWDDLSLERSIFGTTEPIAIAELTLEFALRAFGTPVSDCLFYRSSMGCVFGLSLGNGRTIVLKAQPPNLRLDRLQAAQRVQTHLAQRGFPAPMPILPPTRFCHGYATAEEFCARGEHRNPHVPAVRTALARLLADVALLGDELEQPELRRTWLGKHEGGKLWGTPHYSIFDFEATSSGAEWIDALAAMAQPLLWDPTGDDAVGHADWQSNHVRFEGDIVTAVYDWDSLVYDTEAIVVGHAAHAFTMHSLSGVTIAPSLDEARAFIAAYEEARGRRFVGAERQTLAAALTYSMAYTARCEHSRDPCADPPPVGSYRASLHSGGREWLAI